MHRNYSEMIERRRDEYGNQFDDADLAPAFRAYYETQDRIKVRTAYGEEITGTVGVTTGWRPCFLLMRRSNATGSIDTLDTRDTVIAVKRGRNYITVYPT